MYLSSPKNPDVYFAALEDPAELAGEIWDKVQNFYTRIRGRLYYQRAIESYRMYYGLRSAEDPFDVTQLAPGGDTGSHTMIKINHYYSLGQALVTMATSNRPDWKCVPENEDYESIQDTLLGQDLLDYYMRETGLELAIRQAVESAVIMQDGYVLQQWDPAAGAQVTEDNPILPAQFEGDVTVRALTPFDVPIDLDWRGAGERPWVITRDFVDKWDFAERYPEFRDEILSCQVSAAAQNIEPLLVGGAAVDGDWRENRDQLVVFTLWHRKTKAVPNGLMAIVVDDKTCVFRGGLPYGDHLPLHRIAPTTVAGSTQGHSPQINLIAVQKAISAAWSASVTNLSLFGAGSLLIPKGSGMNVSDIAGGALGIEWDGEKAPEPLNVPGINPSAIQMADMLVKAAETISGVNAAIRGNAPADASGTRLAFQQQMALQYTSGLVQGYTKLLESVGTALIRILQQYATQPKMALIVGSAKAPMLREFSGDDISHVARVVVNSGNAFSKTPAGKIAIADKLFDAGKLTVQQYLMAVDTGTIDPSMTSPMTQQSLIRKENEMLRSAKFVPQGTPGAKPLPMPNGSMQFIVGLPIALATDNHAWHSPEHASVLDSPAARENPAVVAATLAHIAEHEALKTMPGGGLPPPPPGSVPAPPAPPAGPPVPGMDPNPPPDGGAGGGSPAGGTPPKGGQQGPGGAGGPNLPGLPKMPNGTPPSNQPPG